MKIKAYAKINLALEVMDLIDGYHKVNNLMIPINLYDEIEIEKDSDISVIDDPFPNDNIMVKACREFFLYTNINSGAKIRIKKNIPSQAGLGGGSSDAASVLLALNKLYDTKLNDDELIYLSSKLGSDVGFFIKNTVSLCTNRGEVINPLGIKVNPINITLIKPNVGLSTPYVYKNYVYDNISKKNKIEKIIESLYNNNIEQLKNNIFNDLENVALALEPKLKAIYDLLLNNGLKPFVSGSGPTIFLINEDMNKIDLIKNELEKDTFFINTNTL